MKEETTNLQVNKKSINKNNKSMVAFRANDDLRKTLKKMATNFHLSESEVIRRCLSLSVKNLHQPVVHNHFMKRGV